MVRSSTCSTRWCGSAPSGVKRPQNSYLPGRSTSACSASHTRSAAGSVSASYTTFGVAGTTARKRRSGSVIGISLRIAGDGQAERVAVGTAVAGEQVLQRLLQLVEERLALLRAHPDVSGHTDRGQVGPGEVERGDVRLDVLHQVDQVAEAEPIAGLAQPDPAHQGRGQPVGPAGRLVDPLVDAAHPALGHLTDQGGLQQALHVVVDPLRGLVELGRHLGARPGLGELPQHFDPLRLEQGLSLLDLVEVDDVPHDKISLYVKEFFVNDFGPCAAARQPRRCRSRNRTADAASKRGISMCFPALTCSDFSFDANASNRARPPARGMCSSSHWRSNSTGMVIRRAASISADGQNRPKTAAWISGSAAAGGTPVAVPRAMPQYPAGASPISGTASSPARSARHSGTVRRARSALYRSTTGPMGSPALLAACRAAISSSSYGVRGRGPWPPASSARARKPTSVSSRARPDIAGWCRCCPPPCPSRTIGVPGAVCSGAQRTAVTSPSTSSRVVTPSDVMCEIRRRSAGFRSVMGVPLTRKDGAPGGYQAAHPVTEPGSTRDGTTVLLTGLTSQVLGSRSGATIQDGTARSRASRRCARSARRRPPGARGARGAGRCGAGGPGNHVDVAAR